MEVILLENISNLGGLGDKVDVKPGFGRNYLIPQGKAVPATAEAVAEFEARRAELEAAAAEAQATAEQRAEAINALGLITISAGCGIVALLLHNPRKQASHPWFIIHDKHFFTHHPAP